MQALAPSEHASAPAAQKAAKPPRIPKRISQAIDLLASGECRTQKEAAERVNLTPEHLCRMLGKSHVRGVMHARATENLARGTLRASARVLELMDASSEHVSLDAAKHVLGIANIRPPETGANININNSISVGYVIDIAPQQASTRTIEHEAQNDAT